VLADEWREERGRKCVRACCAAEQVFLFGLVNIKEVFRWRFKGGSGAAVSVLVPLSLLCTGRECSVKIAVLGVSGR